jgi:serine phosphatase RsbU (regulator of sigma subunit)
MRGPHELGLWRTADAPAATAASSQPLTLLLVEDDRADTLLVEELIADIDADLRLVSVSSLAQAERELARDRPDCVLLDLHLPDADGIGAVHRVASCDATVPIVVLTGLNDEHVGVSAVAAGAQDYLVKGHVDPEMLRRALLYAVERKRAELTAADLRLSQLREQENARLERGLLPSPLLFNDANIQVVTQYRPSRKSGLLGGDFYDVVQTPDRIVHVLIGDVAGHGPEEAAVGVALRIAWRVLALAGVNGIDRMRQLDRILRVERTRQTFATVLNLAIQPNSPRISVIRAGHPGMLLHRPDSVDWIEPPGGQPLGLESDDWPEHDIELPAGTGLLLLTDGLFEGHSGPGVERLGEDGLLTLARSIAAMPGPQFVDALIGAAEERAWSHGGFTDDVAVVRIERAAR